ncbi:MAG: ribonuclease D, partial [Halioglobus sp.]|nr:ribonuclease D [Halioglobus sp.]
MNIELVDTDARLRDVLAEGEGCAAVMVDTEFMRRNTYYPKVGLLQLCFDHDDGEEGHAWLIDPLALEDTAPIRDLLTDPAVVKVLHSASEDLEVFQHWLGVLPQPLFDTQRAAGLLDIGFGVGYRALVHDITGIDLPKDETRSDWLQRPLSDAQCEYAAWDVILLLRVWRELRQRAVQQNKYDWIVADGADAVAALQEGPANFHQRLKGAWKLRPRQLAALAALCRWREQTARDRDKPRGWIIDDRACLQLAEAEPRNEAQLNAAAELHPAARRRWGKQILQLLAEQRDLPPSEYPEALPQPLGARQRSELKKLKGRARDIAVDLAVAPEALMQSRDYELLLREAAGERVT